MSIAILIIPGHNSHSDKSRFQFLDKELSKRGFAVERFSAAREEHEPGEEVVLAVSEEYEQVLRKASTIDADTVIAVGHSQGAALALRLGYEGVVDGVVSLMGDTSAQEDVNHHLKKIERTLDAVRTDGAVRFERDSGLAFWYTADFFEDYLLWNIPIYASGDYPKLFIAGSQDPWNTPEKVKAFADEAAGDVTYLGIESGHNFEEPQVPVIADAIEDFIQDSAL